jgi:hypothetical protein
VAGLTFCTAVLLQSLAEDRVEWSVYERRGEWWSCVLTSLALVGGVYICRALPKKEIGMVQLKKEKGGQKKYYLRYFDSCIDRIKSCMTDWQLY